ncbi:MAG: DUF721 domain-containing protein [Victivallales bacterium]|nr:DUF721 domain-containing protein [Victivallales bacterium]
MNDSPEQHWLQRTDHRTNDAFGDWTPIPFPSARENSREETLADWLGPERAPEVFAQLRHETHTAKELMETIVGQFPCAEILVLQKLEKDWPRLVTPMLARECHPFKVQNGVLYVEVFHSTWMFVFRNQHADKIQQIVSQESNGKVTRVVFQPAGSHKRPL